MSTHKEQFLAELRNITEQDGRFRLISDKWIGSDEKHQFEHIESGEMFECAPSQVKQRGFPKMGCEWLTELRKLTENDGRFRLVSDKWLGAMEKHRFEHIKSGELFECTPSNIKKKGFPKIDSEKLAGIRQLAKQDGRFRLVSDK